MTWHDFLFRRDAGARPVGAGAGEMTGEQAQEARVRARRRLIGAVVLLGVGVIAFPLLFETQPRPIPVDIPIVIPPREGAPPLALPAPRSSPRPAASAPAVAAAPSGAVTVAAAPAPAASAPAMPPPPSVAPAPPEPAPAKPEAAKPAPKPEAKPAAKAQAETAPKTAAPAAPPSSARFVVQIGAFAEAAAVRETRAKAQKAGVSTYTQVVETSGGKRTRVRVGPFNSREDAEKAAEKVKAAGLPVSVVPL